MNRILPFCMRCFGIGIGFNNPNFCHQCGSEGTCIPMEEKNIEYLQENIDGAIQHKKKYGEYTQEDCAEDTMKHINQVREFMFSAAIELIMRANLHDASKLSSPELEIFTKYTPKLKNSAYGSDEYKTFLKEMKPALDHHYANNRHHPEYFRKYVCTSCHSGYTTEPDLCIDCGNFHFDIEIDYTQMNLIDIVEMLCDWKAASMRHENGDINKSIEINEKRFNISDDLIKILKNTADYWWGSNG